MQGHWYSLRWGGDKHFESFWRRDPFVCGWRCVWPSKCSFVPAMVNHHNIGVFWGPYTLSTVPKIIPACLGGCRPSIWCISAEHKASCGALGGRFLMAAAMVGYSCVGQCWPLEADIRSYCRNSLNCLWKIYLLFLRWFDTFLTSDPAAK